MGNLVSSAAPRTALAGIDGCIAELPNITYDRSLGSSRFLKTVRCSHPDGPVVVKLFIKPEPGLSLKRYIKELMVERDLLQGIPNILVNHQIAESERAGFMVRQYIASNLYDRLSNRPFLTSFEKKWLSFQLLVAVVEAHSRQICHGDIKTENIFVTTWNWAYLADFSAYKPTFIPEDNPADFTFFFDTSSRRACYLAPERFYEPGGTLFVENGSKLTPEMDIFALGCTIAEIYLEGIPIFTLAQLLQYRKGAYDPSSTLLEKIDDVEIRSLVKHMIQRDPNMRMTAQDYMKNWRDKAFPEYFYSFLHQYMASLSDPYYAANSPQYHVFLANNAPAVVTDADAKIDRIYFDFDKIAQVFEFADPIVSSKLKDAQAQTSVDSRMATSAQQQGEGKATQRIPKLLLPVHVHIPNFTCNTLSIIRSERAADASLVLIAAICSCIRNTMYPASRIRGLDLLLAFGIQISDEHKLDRIVPYIVALLGDESPTVRINALTTLTQLLLTVKSLTPSDANIFPEYLLPSLRRFATDSNVLARAAYAQCISTIAEIALQFLELAQILKAENTTDLDMDTSLFQISYDTNLRDLQETIQEDVVALLIDSESIVKRSLLYEMPSLCIFFGRQKANDILLSHMITYLNDQDASLRSAFCETIVGVGTFVGMRSLEEYILPLMIQALTDSEEFVVEKVLSSLTSLAELGLIAKSKLKELCTTMIPLCCHPNRWIRHSEHTRRHYLILILDFHLPCSL
eukprot:jgi/Hompol1/6943/HPOL_000975-RA